MSRFFDGELEPPRVGHVVKAIRQEGSESARQFDDYVLISDVLKGLTPRLSDAVLSERIAKAIQQEPVYMGSARNNSSAHSERFQKGRQVFRLGALAASVAAVGFVSMAMWQLVTPEQSLVASAGQPNSAPATVAATGSTVGPVGGASLVPVASWADPKTREMLDAHGSMAVRLRVAGER
ncbi:MAG: sigma-E factor negative regulatory protein [Burkholderiaceae bacterium]